MNLEAMIEQIDEEIARLEQARAVLTSGNHGEKSHAPATKETGKPAGEKRTMSAKGRKAIAEAQRARWAKVKAKKAPAKAA